MASQVSVYSASFEAEIAGIDHIDANQPVALGVTPPAEVVSVQDGGVTGEPDGTYTYKITFVNGEGFESNLSEASESIIVATHKIRLYDIPVSSDPQVTARRIYRTEDEGATYKRVITIEENYTTTYDDNISDADLGAEAETTHDIPEVFSEVHMHNSLLWAVEAARKNVIWRCSAFDEWEYFPTTNYEAFGAIGDETRILETLAQYLVVVEKARIWRYNTRVDPEEKNESLSTRGVGSPQACVNMGDSLVLGGSSGLFQFDAVRDILFSQLLDPLFDPESGNSERLSTSYLSNMCVGYFDEKVYFSYTRQGQTTNDRTLIFDKEAKIFQGVLERGFNVFVTDREGGSLYALGTDGYVYLLETGTDDDAVAIAWDFQTKDFASELGGRFVRKRGRAIEVDINPANAALTVKVYLDGTLRQTEAFSDAARTIRRFEFDSGYDFYRLSLKFSGLNSSQKVYGALISTKEVGVQRAKSGLAIGWSQSKAFNYWEASGSWYLETRDLAEELGGRLTYKRGEEIKIDIDPAGEDLTVQVFLDGTSRQSRTYDDASRVVKNFRFTPEYDFYRMKIRFSGATMTQRVHGLEIGSESIGEISRDI